MRDTASKSLRTELVLPGSVGHRNTRLPVGFFYKAETILNLSVTRIKYSPCFIFI